MKYILIGLLMLASNAGAQTSPFYLRDSKANQDFGGLNNNFNDITNPRRDNLVPIVFDNACSSGSALTGATQKGGYIFGGSCNQVAMTGTGSNNFFSSNNVFGGSTTFTGSIFGTINVSSAVQFNADFTGNAAANGACVGSTITLTTQNVPVDIIFNGSMGSSGNGDTPFLSVLVDSVFLPGFSTSVPMMHSREPGGASVAHFPVGLYYRTRSALSLGSHTFCIVFNRGTGGAGTATLFCGTSPCSFEIREVR